MCTKIQITMEILDDNQYEPDEQFYLKLSLTGTKTTKQRDVMLGRISIMEVTVLNDDGQYCPFEIFRGELCIKHLNPVEYRSWHHYF
jgi:hypothetical protein